VTEDRAKVRARFYGRTRSLFAEIRRATDQRGFQPSDRFALVTGIESKRFQLADGLVRIRGIVGRHTGSRKHEGARWQLSALNDHRPLGHFPPPLKPICGLDDVSSREFFDGSACHYRISIAIIFINDVVFNLLFIIIWI
jgi:hypothetical protein